MADDTRQALRVDPDSGKAFQGQQWEGAAPPIKAPENANALPGGTANTAGGKVEDVTVVDAAKSIKLEEFSQIHRKPCVKDSLLTGIGTGFAMGSVRAIWRTPIAVACNWAVGTFCFSALAMYQYCNHQRTAEKEGMKRAMEIIDRKQIERKQKEARMERIRELRRQRKEEEDQENFEKLRQGGETSQKPSWKLW